MMTSLSLTFNNTLYLCTFYVFSLTPLYEKYMSHLFSLHSNEFKQTDRTHA